jgi:cell division septation protein DedD
MARDWRRAVLAALATLALGGACLIAAHAQAPDDDHDGEPKAAASGKPRQDPAEAQRAIEASMKHLQAGRADQAVQAMTATLAGGNLPPAIMAKAFYVRGRAYRQLGQPAQAVSDLGSALWLKGGLGGDERADAIKEKAAAYADAGLAVRGDADVAEPRPKAGSGGNWLSGLFGAPGAPAPQTSAAPARRVEPAPAGKAPAAAIGGWSGQTEVVSDRTELAAAPAAEPPRPEPPPAPAASPPPRAQSAGGHLIQLNAVRTEPEARALAAKAKREHAVLASRESTIDRAVFGNMGAFYLVRFGPFASAEETQAVCSKLQGSGLDCLPVAP